MLHTYKSIYITADSLAMTRCVTIYKNQNIAHLYKLLLQWYFKLGRTSLSMFQWVGSQGWMENLGENMVSNNVKINKCAYLQYGKQEINPKYGTS